MARPRKDGKPPARALRTGREAISASGKKWRVRPYAPTDGAPYGRIVYLTPTTGKRSMATASQREHVFRPELVVRGSTARLRRSA